IPHGALGVRCRSGSAPACKAGAARPQGGFDSHLTHRRWPCGETGRHTVLRTPRPPGMGVRLSPWPLTVEYANWHSGQVESLTFVGSPPTSATQQPAAGSRPQAVKTGIDCLLPAARCRLRKEGIRLDEDLGC